MESSGGEQEESISSSQDESEVSSTRDENLAAKFLEGDDAVKYWFFGSLVWFPIFATLGFILAIKFFQPYFLSDAAFLTFGRIRPAHVNGVLFGFVSSALIGGMFWTLPRLANTPIYSARLAKLSAMLWNLALLTGIILILFLAIPKAGNMQNFPGLSMS